MIEFKKNIPTLVYVGAGAALVAGRVFPNIATNLTSQVALGFVAFVYVVIALCTLCAIVLAMTDNLDRKEIHAIRDWRWMHFAVAGFLLMVVGMTGFGWAFIVLAIARKGMKLWAEEA